MRNYCALQSFTMPTLYNYDNQYASLFTSHTLHILLRAILSPHFLVLQVLHRNISI